MHYILKKDHSFKKISLFDMDIMSALEIKPKNMDDSFLKVNHLYLVEEELVKTMIFKKVMKKVARIFSILKKLLETDDPDPTILGVFLDEISKLRLEIKSKYRLYLKEEDYEMFLKRLTLFEENIKKEFVKNHKKEEIIGKSR